MMVEQCKPCPKAQPATHVVQPVLSFCSWQTALPWTPALHSPSSVLRTQPSHHYHRGLCISCLPAADPCCEQAVFSASLLPQHTCFHLPPLRLGPHSCFSFLQYCTTQPKGCGKVCPLLLLSVRIGKSSNIINFTTKNGISEIDYHIIFRFSSLVTLLALFGAMIL